LPELPDILNVLVVQRASERVIERIKAIAPERLNVVAAIPDTLPELQFQVPGGMARSSGQGAGTSMMAAERATLIKSTHVVFAGVPYPGVMPSLAPDLIWAHFGFAGTSNLKGTEWWDTSFITTSSRGYVAALPIAEAVIAGMFALARKLDVAVENGKKGRFESSDYAGIKLIGGKTMAIIGLGGIGSQVAKLAKGVGMRVIATRHSATSRQQDVDGVDELYPASETHAMLAEADFVAVCTMWTDETERMLNADAFAAMKPGAHLMNISRGEVIDNEAMAAALHSAKLAGAYLDVWDDDFVQPPPRVLREAPNIIFTPHVSNRSDVPQMFAGDIFCANLQRLLRGEALENVVDWERGY
jgi:D-2-hydroxyacid dehydrogenase (NADP+)